MNPYSPKVLKPIDKHACQITYESKQREVAKIADEADAFQPHDDNTCRWTNDKDATTRACTIRQQISEVSMTMHR